MRKVSLKFVSVVLGIVFILVLFACPKPVNYDGISWSSGNPGGSDPGGGDPGEEPDHPLKLVWDVTGEELVKDDEITVSISGVDFPASGVITVTNAEDYDAGTIKWYCNDNVNPLITGVEGDLGEEFTVMAGSVPFGAPGGSYLLGVFGYIGAALYSTPVIIKVVP